MNYRLDKGAHSVYALHYHFVQCVKYRKRVFIDERYVELIRTKVYEISKTFGVEVINLEFDKDHYHMVFKGKPTLDLTKYINAIKTITSREIRREFPEIKQALWGDAFWSPSYFLATTGQVTIDVLKRYVEGQRTKRHAPCPKD
jgi:putative transposase